MALSRILSAALLVALLAACGNQPPKATIPPRPPRESVLQFWLEGRIAVRLPERSSTMRISWEHAPQSDTIGFSSPLGNQLAELQRDAHGARWLAANGEHHEAHDADQLIWELTDIPVPLDNLILWTTGRVSPLASVLAYDTAGRLREALDEGWTVRVTAYETDQPNALPTALEIEGSGMRVKFAIETWQL